MKFINNIAKFLISLIFISSMFVVYDIFLILKWLNMELTERFTVCVSLNEGTNIEDLTNQIVVKIKKMKLSEIKYINKQDVYETVRREDDLSDIVSILRTNPFSDVIRFKIKNFSWEEIVSVLSTLSSYPDVKDVIYDEDLLLYLKRLGKIIEFYKFFCIFIFLFAGLVIFLRLSRFDIKGVKIYQFIIFTFLYLLVFFVNIKAVGWLVKYEEFIDIFFVVVSVIIYTTSLLNFIIEYNVKRETVNV
ncbi:MAG: hypothetical protein RMJ13_04615 [Elusimicrobiota bacterium]|nr:hypothetical protein [Elusimicrobiota bacterium]